MSKHQIISCIFIAFTLIYGIGFFLWNWSFILYFFVFIIWLILTIYGSFQIRFNYHLKAITNIKTTQKVVAITFDDGPSEFTTEILKLFENQPHKATFFCVGKNIKQHPEIFKNILKQGHDIGNHTYSHAKNMGFKNPTEIIAEIEKTNQIIEKYTGQKNTYFRPPFGVTNPSIRKAVQQTKHKVIGWNIRSLDAVIKNEEKIFQRIIKKIAPGSIILLHDTSEKSVEVVKKLLAYLNKENYQSLTIEEFLKLEK